MICCGFPFKLTFSLYAPIELGLSYSSKASSIIAGVCASAAIEAKKYVSPSFKVRIIAGLYCPRIKLETILDNLTHYIFRP